MARILLAPLLVALLLPRDREASVVAAVVFVVGALTDGVDGYIARRYAAVTRTGEWLDPLADKLLVSAPVVTLTALHVFPLWAAGVILVREFGIAGLRAWSGRRGRPMPASKAAKVKTVLQMLAITLYILPLDDRAGLRLPVLVAAALLTVATGLDYVVRTVQLEVAGRRLAR